MRELLIRPLHVGMTSAAQWGWFAIVAWLRFHSFLYQQLTDRMLILRHLLLTANSYNQCLCSQSIVTSSFSWTNGSVLLAQLCVTLKSISRPSYVSVYKVLNRPFATAFLRAPKHPHGLYRLSRKPSIRPSIIWPALYPGGVCGVSWCLSPI